ncbi:hypothetical protein PVAND_004066 [Polypedilum vanderplanki]|uniref:DUF1308 domain-containing protein n=1 Tax=Polypedilum vanderplanki TaxID=319348 RepID=A0A9J6BW03_POLVA|nr:hypothetical protein PVAND_004066 [Polypedilum vanderplanki]
MHDKHETELQIDEKINLAKNLIEKLENDFNSIDGGNKTKRLIEKELKFLNKLRSNFESEKVTRQLQCTNLNFYEHLVNSLYIYQIENNVSAIGQIQRNSEDKNIRVDIVCDNKQEVLWIKIIARNSNSLIDGVMGRTEYGTKDILEIADDYIKMAQNSKSNFFRQPKVIFDFLNPIDTFLEKKLEEKGVLIGRKYKNQEKQRDHQIILNCDISTMLAYVSELSNGGSHYHFDEKLIQVQADVERKKPIKPILDAIFENKKLIACETAVKSFDEIINLLAGPNEKRRAEEFKKCLVIYSDSDIDSEKVLNIKLTSQIKERSRKIFAFGIVHKAITVTSNVGFIRAARMKNFVIPNATHSARALTELKQKIK